MKRVWKYDLEPNSVKDSQHPIVLSVPVGAKPLCIMVQDHVVRLWMEVDEPVSRPTEYASFELLCIGTGHGVPEGRYFASVVHNQHVWHFYLPE